LDSLRANVYGANASFISTIHQNLYIANTLQVSHDAYFQGATSFSNLVYVNQSSLITVANVVSTVDSVLNNQPAIYGLQTYGF
jgi:hypothetical protein